MSNTIIFNRNLNQEGPIFVVLEKLRGDRNGVENNH